jgi:hypothetical protein
MKYLKGTLSQQEPRRKVYFITKSVKTKRGSDRSQAVFREGTYNSYAGLKFDAVSIDRNEGSEPVKVTDKLEVDPSDYSNIS